jgi:hypothetical protein
MRREEKRRKEMRREEKRRKEKRREEKRRKPPNSPRNLQALLSEA